MEVMTMSKSFEHGRGKIKHNALFALVTSPAYKSKVEKDKKKYNRKEKHKAKDFD